MDYTVVVEKTLKLNIYMEPGLYDVWQQALHTGELPRKLKAGEDIIKISPYPNVWVIFQLVANRENYFNFFTISVCKHRDSLIPVETTEPIRWLKGLTVLTAPYLTELGLESIDINIYRSNESAKSEGATVPMEETERSMAYEISDTLFAAGEIIRKISDGRVHPDDISRAKSCLRGVLSSDLEHIISYLSGMVPENMEEKNSLISGELSDALKLLFEKKR